MKRISSITHVSQAIGLRLFGLGPRFTPCSGIQQLKELFDQNTFWATNRSLEKIKLMLKNSTVIVTLWDGKKIIGFGRATSDGAYRAVLWDIIIDKEIQGNGLGRKVVDILLRSPKIKTAEKIYLMTTNQIDFYKTIGFKKISNQSLMLLQN
tara:strand:- start:1 stop:456 length:456 start_codon:yes stop_codon:yes gene_type:complete